MGVVQTITRELLDLTGQAKSSQLDSLRAQINFSKRKIINLQNELQNLKSAELLILQKMNRFTRLETIEQYYPNDRVQSTDPIQASKPIQNYGTPDPDPSINWTRNRLAAGLEPLNSERNRVGAEILKTGQQIQIQWQILEGAQTKLQQMNEGKVAIEASIAKDGIAKRAYTEIYMLYEINQKAIENKFFKNKGDLTVPGWLGEVSPGLQTDDAGKVKEQNRLRKMFRYYAMRNPYVIKGELFLNLDQPDDTKNTLALKYFLDRMQQVLGPKDFTNYDEKTKKYTELMIANVNDDFISQNVARQEESSRVPEPDSAFRNITQNLATTLNNYVEKIPGVKTYINWSEKTFGGAVTKWFQKQMTNLYGGMPYCTPQPQTDAEKAQTAAVQATQQTDSTAQLVYATQYRITATHPDMREISTTVNKLLSMVDAVVKNPDGEGVLATTSLAIDNTIYQAINAYQVRILNTARRVEDYLVEQLTTGSITPDQYNFWKKSLQTSLSLVSPPLTQTG